MPEDASIYQGWRLDLRDPAALADFVPSLEWAYENYFRVEASGVENLPRRGPCLLIGNHSGGIMASDVAMTLCLWCRHRSLALPFYGLVHPHVFDIPVLNRFTVKIGGIRAHAKMAMRALAEEAVLLIYPGGGDDSYRPFWRRNEIVFAGRSGFVRLALKYRVPIVPIVTVGAHDTLLVLDDGRRLAEALGLTKRYGIERVPISLTVPWGLTIGAWWNVPLAAKIQIGVGEPIELARPGRSQGRDRDEERAGYDLVLETMQGMMNSMVGADRAHPPRPPGLRLSRASGSDRAATTPVR
jgi:1-acyl-sn-glycerol-3-phosphate acyltransferase